MSLKDEITKAIAAHGQWKLRLKTAIETGSLDFTVDTIRSDDQCVFGKWLYGDTITPEIKASPHYSRVKTLHARFHQEAAKVAEAVLAGRKTEAETSMGITGDFTRASTELTRAMMDWLAQVS